MCSYCGCHDITVIGRLMDEHEAIQNAAGELRRTVVTGGPEDVAAGVAALAGLLDPHVEVEERGLFGGLRDDPEFAPHIDRLCGEHVTLEAALDAVRGGDLTGLDALLRLLDAHIEREDNGVFPAAATALDGPSWDRITDRLNEPAAVQHHPDRVTEPRGAP
ncbi:hemerythrin domain-containing protein [Aquipuribacter hungaricus]|uniref:hemerythrin domain-containing protein n=1 Tax=Aquipuribacter hungaricus TaxID=545624 RepID=UPI003611DEA7